jgi:hypothetical protein
MKEGEVRTLLPDFIVIGPKYPARRSMSEGKNK